MTDELKQKLTERFDKLTPRYYSDPMVYDALLKIYLAGGEYGYEIGKDETVDNACEWLEDFIKNFDFYEQKDVEAFRKAMEE